MGTIRNLAPRDPGAPQVARELARMNLSLNYYLNVDLLPQVVERGQLEQSVLLRASWALF